MFRSFAFFSACVLSGASSPDGCATCSRDPTQGSVLLQIGQSSMVVPFSTSGKTPLGAILLEKSGEASETSIDFDEHPEGKEIREGGPGGAEAWTPCTTPYRTCVDGYRMPSKCSFPFKYKGKEYHSCIPSSVGHRHWCSIHSRYLSWGFSGLRCVPCTEQGIIPEQDQGQALVKDLACTDIIVTGGSMTSGRRSFTFINGWSPQITQVQFPLYSGGKFPGTVAIAGAVHSGHLSWDTRANEVFDWWTKSAGDPKSRVTLRNLLHFSSGFWAPAMGHLKVRCIAIGSLVPYTLEECAREIYEMAYFDEKRLGEWKDSFNYNSMHQVIALAMAAKTTGLNPTEYLKKYLYEPAAMTHTTVYPSSHPILAAFMVSTVDDFDSFLSKYLTYQILPKEIVDVIEADSGNGGGTWINAMGINTAGTVHGWGGSIYHSVDRQTQTYQLISPPLKEYPGGAAGKWQRLHRLIERFLAKLP